MALAKSMISIFEFVLIWVHHHPNGGLSPRNQEIWTPYGLRLDMFVMGATTPIMGGSSLSDINVKNIGYTPNLDMKWLNHPL